ncbi:MAG: 6,7-dimethyl-8-ribityllumazine synthase [Gammaproteobacteria bacterium]|nr:6,7-dimethyl-8-ribityllumazine synthase [Gammaproteobacteria bacterium]
MNTQLLSPRIAIACSRFNRQVTDLLLQEALSGLQQCGVLTENIKVIKVAGAIELPLVIQLLAQTKQYDAIICLGSVIRGETPHFDYVCEQVSQGCQQVMLKFSIPVIFGVLTTNDLQQALERAGGNHSNTGVDCANTAIEMIALSRELKSNCLLEAL